jgi:hypothetical protein
MVIDWTSAGSSSTTPASFGGAWAHPKKRKHTPNIIAMIEAQYLLAFLVVNIQPLLFVKVQPPIQ